MKMNKLPAPHTLPALLQTVHLQKAVWPEDEPFSAMEFITDNAVATELSRREMNGCRFQQCNLPESRFQKSYLRDVVFDRCDLSCCNFTRANLTRVQFIDCRLTGAIFAGCYCSDLQMIRCRAPYSNFTQAKLHHVTFTGCDLHEAAIDDCKVGKDALHFSDCDLTDASLSHTSMNGLDLSDSQIDGIAVTLPELKGAIVSPIQACELSKLLGIIIKSGE